MPFAFRKYLLIGVVKRQKESFHFVESLDSEVVNQIVNCFRSLPKYLIARI